ncbi:hypothetical protein MHBO_004527 [Bonamia ostreae]|uniref:Uncharacterized protein n=2 Tax=Bonamia ostreae TaxID=126728 RepID=A0ABV2ATL2_9EUKA
MVIILNSFYQNNQFGIDDAKQILYEEIKNIYSSKILQNENEFKKMLNFFNGENEIRKSIDKIEILELNVFHSSCRLLSKLFFENLIEQ